MKAILLTFHVGPAAGYAIDSLLETFIQMARRLVVEEKNIHVAFPRMNGIERCLAVSGISNLVEFDPSTRDPGKLGRIERYIREHDIDVVFGFDQPVQQFSCRHMRKAGVRWIISYQGAPMSGINKGIKLLLKRMEVLLAVGSPDHYIFESRAMAETAYRGRGIPFTRTSIVHLGVEESLYRPPNSPSGYAYDVFTIPHDRKIIYYSGHMEERKGVAVLMRTARTLFEQHGRRDFHWLLLGNRDGEERPFLEMLEDTGARAHVTFGGYRKDIDQILKSCYLGTIASTGWDSFTMSALEMSSSGLPLLVSRLQGLVETVDEGITGYTFTPGEHAELASCIAGLLDDPERRDKMGAAARRRILTSYTRQQQIANLVNVVKQVTMSG